MTNVLVWATAVGLLASPGARGQESRSEAHEAKAEPPRKAVITTPLRVQVLFTKLQGERKVASLPYTLVCNADENRFPSRVRMGIEVPLASAVAKNPDAPAALHYKNVGTNIDCSASAAADGRYKLNLSIEQSSVYSGPESGTRAPGAPGTNWTAADLTAAGAPLFRTFSTTFSPILRDGESSQYTVATDPVSGEVVRIDVTVNVVK